MTPDSAIFISDDKGFAHEALFNHAADGRIEWG